MMVAMVVAGAASARGAAKYATPAEVIAAYEKAHDANDDAAAVDCFSPEGMNRSVKFMVAMEMATRQPEPGAAAAAPTPEEKKAHAAMDALLAKHGIKDLATRQGEDSEAYVNRITAPVTDPRGLMLDLMKFLETGAKPAPCRKGEVADLKINGDDATGKYVVKDPDGSSSSQDLKFKNIDGSWRLADVVMLSSSETPEPANQPAKP
jgi:hypothetical protein